MQAAIGASNAVAFDLTAACSGFVVGLITAAQFIRTGAAKNVVVIGADALSRYVDWRDRGGWGKSGCDDSGVCDDGAYEGWGGSIAW